MWSPDDVFTHLPQPYFFDTVNAKAARLAALSNHRVSKYDSASKQYLTGGCSMVYQASIPFDIELTEEQKQLLAHQRRPMTSRQCKKEYAERMRALNPPQSAAELRAELRARDAQWAKEEKLAHLKQVRLAKKVKLKVAKDLEARSRVGPLPAKWKADEPSVRITDFFGKPGVVASKVREVGASFEWKGNQATLVE